MTGKVKMYNDEKGYGFILGDDGMDYFVHISDIKTAETLYRGAEVSFTPDANDKGKIAKNVLLTQVASNRPPFIQFGDVRIKLSNIKNYGIGQCSSYYSKVYEYDAQAAQQIADEHKKKHGLISTLLSIFEGSPYTWKGEKIYVASFSEEAALRKLGIDPYNPHDYTPSCYIRNPDGSLEPWSRENLLKVQESYLYVTTYQGDNFQFPEGAVDFDIFNKCKEIDSYML